MAWYYENGSIPSGKDLIIRDVYRKDINEFI